MSLAVGSVLGIAVVAALPSGGSSAMGDTCVLAGDGHLYTYNGAAWVDNGAAGGGGGGAAIGSVVVDFGAGGQVAETVVADATVTASTTIVPNIAGSTADNNEFVHSALPARVGVTVSPGVGYTVRIVSDWRVSGTLNVVFLRG